MRNSTFNNQKVRGCNKYFLRFRSRRIYLICLLKTVCAHVHIGNFRTIELCAPRGFQKAFERSIYIKLEPYSHILKLHHFVYTYTRRGGNVLQPFCSSIYSYICVCGSLTCMIALILYVICTYHMYSQGWQIHMNIKSTNFIFESKIYEVYI